MFTRVHRSQVRYPGPLGWGWDFNYNRRMRELPQGDILFYDGSGRRERFKAVKRGEMITGYEAPEGWFVTLRRTEDGFFRLVHADRTVEFYDEFGRLDHIRDRNKNDIFFYYNPAGQLTGIMDDMGRLITLAYYPYAVPADGSAIPVTAGRLERLTDYTGRAVEYRYNDAGDLETVVNHTRDADTGAARTRTYVYKTDAADEKEKHNITAYNDAEGRTMVSIAYLNDNVDTVTRGGAATTFACAPTDASVTDAKNNTVHYRLDGAGHIDKISEGIYDTVFAYTSPHGLLERVTFPNGNFTTYTYDVSNTDPRFQGNVIAVTQHPGVKGAPEDEPQRTTSIAYDSRFNQVKQITYPNTLTISNDSFDDNGNVTSTSNNVFDMKSTYAYHPSRPGVLVSESTPWGKTEYRYHPEDAPGGEPVEQRGRDGNPDTGGYLKQIDGPMERHTYEKYDQLGHLTDYNNSMGVTGKYSVNDFSEVTAETVNGLYPGTFGGASYYRSVNTYYKNGLPQTQTTSLGGGHQQVTDTTTYTYDARNNLETVSDGLGATTYDYDLNDNITGITDPLNNKVAFSYDARDMISTVTVGNVEKNDFSTYGFHYDGNGNMEKFIDAYGNVMAYDYDGYNRLRSVSDPLSNTLLIGRQNKGRDLIYQSMDPAGTLLRQTTRIHDPLGRMTGYTVAGPQGEAYPVTYAYENDGKIVTITDWLNRKSIIHYNDQGDVIKQIDAVGNTVEYFYNEAGRGNMNRKKETIVTKETDPVSGQPKTEVYETKFYYNAFNKIERIIDPQGGETLFIYDGMGNLNFSIDAEGNQIEHTYDKFGRCTSTSRYLDASDKITTTFTYYADGKLMRIEDHKGHITNYEYDFQNRISKIIYPGGSFNRYVYGQESIGETTHRTLTETQRNGTIVKTTFDANGRVWKRDITPAAGVEGTTTEHYEYDALSRLTKAVNNDSTVERQYDALNRITREKQMGKYVHYTYQNLTTSKTMRQTLQYPGSLTNSNGRILERNFDLLNRMSQIKDGDNTIVDYGFIGRTYRMMSKQFGNGDLINYLYDQGRRVISKETKNSSGGLINHYGYGYNKIHMKTHEQRFHDGGKGDVYSYDRVQRLTGVKYDTPTPTAPAPTDFAKSWSAQYDKVDNILNIVKEQDNQTQTITPEIPQGTDYEKLNQYAAFDGFSLTYDGNGNTKTKGNQTFYYDYRNQLVRVAENGTTTAQYTYDPFGRRIKKAIGENLFTYYYSGDQMIEERDASDTVTRQFVYGNGIDELLRMDKFINGVSTPYYFHTNDIGSVTAVTDASGALVERVTYDTFGNASFTDYLTDPTNPTAANTSIIGNDILFQGRRFDSELGLYYYRARHYDPLMGRFLQIDPMGYQDSMNLYQAFNMNGVNFLDPMGLIALFFDGTNNDMNDPNKAMTHIGALYQIYQGEKRYINGVGTRTDITTGMIYGEGFEERIMMADLYFLKHYNQGEKVWDIFGFSRGAAMARHFINRISKRHPDVKIRFLGLYDTVAQFGFPDIFNVDKTIHLDIPKNVEYVAHAVAKDEYRRFFPGASIIKDVNKKIILVQNNF